MSLSSWLSGTFSHSQARRGKRRNPAARLKKARFTLEPLEARALLASYTAASISDLIADITAANTNGGANTITLTAATTAPYVLTAVNNTTKGATGLPVIAANDNLTVVGAGDTIERSTASGTPFFRFFDVATGGLLTLQTLTLQGGYADAATGTQYWEGGAIYNQGALTLSGVTVQHNYAEIGGGGIYSYYGSVTLEGGSSVSYNQVSSIQAGFGGGLLAEDSTVTVTDATIDNNSAYGAVAAYGGGMCIIWSTATVTNATLNNNSVKSTESDYDDGGGLYAGPERGDYLPPGKWVTSTVAVTNSTLDDNSAGGNGAGGGLCTISGTATLSNDTVESNTANALGGGLYFWGSTATLSNDTVESNTADIFGGGIYIAGGTVTLDPFTVANTINNTDISGLNGSTANIDGKYTLS